MLYPHYGPPTQPTYDKPNNTKAYVAFFVVLIFSIPGTILAHQALRENKRCPMHGKTAAVLALIIGYTKLALWLSYFIYILTITAH